MFRSIIHDWLVVDYQIFLVVNTIFDFYQQSIEINNLYSIKTTTEIHQPQVYQNRIYFKILVNERYEILTVLKTTNCFV